MKHTGRIHAVPDEYGDRIIYGCTVGYGCDADYAAVAATCTGAPVIGSIESGREFIDQWGNPKVEFRFVASDPDVPAGDVHLGKIARAYEDARGYARTLVTADPADRGVPTDDPWQIGVTAGPAPF